MTSLSYSQPEYPKVDLEMAERFISILKGKDPVCWQTFADNRKNRRARARILHGALKRIKDDLVREQGLGAGIYVVVNRTDGKGRRRENVVAATAVFVDGDNIPLPKNWPIEPHIICLRDETHWHAYWLIVPTDDLAAWTLTQKRVANFLGTDPKISDPPRVLRVPGFWHQKGDPIFVILIRCPSTADLENGKITRYTLEELEQAFPGQLPTTSPQRKNNSSSPIEQVPLLEWDLEVNINEAIHYLENEAPLAIEHQQGDDQTLRVAAKLKDLCISEKKALELMIRHWNPRCNPPWVQADLKKKVRHAFKYLRKTQPGSSSPLIDPGAANASEWRTVLKEWIWVVEAKAFLRRADCQMWDRDQFESYYSHLIKGKLWQTIIKQKLGIRRFERLTYQPGQPELPMDGRYNIWRPSAIEPKAGEVEWFLQHMQYLIPDEKERQQVLDFLAYLVQHPGIKIHFALVIQGLPGTGKSFVGQLMEIIIGLLNTSRPSNEELHSQWTTWQRQAQLVIVEELMTIGRQDLINKLKSVIADATIRIQEKYRNTYSLDNCLNFLMFTNYKDALKVELNDRRFFVVFSPALPKDPSYYAALFSHLQKDGAAHVAQWFMERDLSAFRPKGVAPHTWAKQEMRQSNMDEVHQVLWELHDNGESPFDSDLLSMKDLEHRLPDRLQRVKNLNGKLTTFLRDHLGAVKFEQIPVDKGAHKKNLWVWRNHDEWRAQTKTQVGLRYDARIKHQKSDNLGRDPFSDDPIYDDPIFE